MHPTAPQSGRELPPALRRLSEALGGADDLAVAVVVDADGYHDGDALAGSAPAALQVDAVDVDVGAGALDRAFRHSSTEANAFPFRLETVAAETPDRQMTSNTSPILLVETPARSSPPRRGTPVCGSAR